MLTYPSSPWRTLRRVSIGKAASWLAGDHSFRTDHFQRDAAGKLLQHLCQPELYTQETQLRIRREP